MTDKKVLFVASEMVPYLPENEVSSLAYESPRMVNEMGGQIRIFMPRFGNINERRHQLHEVIRLSGMNLVINDMDMPLIIKVASIPKERIQVYFIDSEDFFERKAMLHDPKTGELFKDNDERAIFFARGVLETVKKLGWVPDIVHCHGWMTSLVPLYIKTSYSKDPVFENAKVVYSLYNNDYDGKLNKDLIKKAYMEGMDKDRAKDFAETCFVGLNKAAINCSDALIKGSESINNDLQKIFDDFSGPKLDYQSPEEYINVYSEFYDEVHENSEVLIG